MEAPAPRKMYLSCCFRSPGLLNVERQSPQNWRLGDVLLPLGMEGEFGSGVRSGAARSNSEEEKLISRLDVVMLGNASRS